MSKNKIILDLCGGTGSWSDPYKKAGYDVRVITLPKYDITKFEPGLNIYGILAAPPCNNFSKANRLARSKKDLKGGMKIVYACLNTIWKCQYKQKIKFWALENPLGLLYDFLGKPAFYFQPWEFNDQTFRATKRTALWGKFNPPIKTVKCRSNIIISNRKHRTLPGLNFRKFKNVGFNQSNKKRRSKTSNEFAKAFFKANQ